jgi:anaerobic ribonucleoside-triphosphate reductase activating protein
MIKYVDYEVVLEDIPDRITLAVNISNCQCNCKGCHSSYLRKDTGKELTKEIIDSKLSNILKSCDCFLFLGEGNDIDKLFEINDYIKEKYNIETALYSGRDEVEDYFYDKFDYVKIGRYDEKYGGLDKITTNQKLYYKRKDITSIFS